MSSTSPISWPVATTRRTSRCTGRRERQWTVRIGGRSHEVTVLTHDPLRLLVDGREAEASALDERAAASARGASAARGGRHELRAPMPGLLKAVHVTEGDVVERGAPI